MLVAVKDHGPGLTPDDKKNYSENSGVERQTHRRRIVDRTGLVHSRADGAHGTAAAFGPKVKQAWAARFTLNYPG